MSKRIIIAGVAYPQQGLEVLAKVEAGQVPPPSKDGRRHRVLGPYHTLIVKLNRKGFTGAAIHRILTKECRFAVSQPTVNSYLASAGLCKPNNGESYSGSLHSVA